MIRFLDDFPTAGSFLGREAVTLPGRIDSEMSLNKTVAFTPKILLKSIKSALTAAVDRITTYLPVSLSLIESLSSDIKDHFETRLQNDFTLFSQVYKTNLIFSAWQTQHQVGQAEGSKSSYAAAHSCTFPNLVCKRPTEETWHMFAYESSSYMNRNATTIVPVEVNKIDTALEAGIRRIGISIINDLANGENPPTPKEAFMKYLAAMSTQLETMLVKREEDPIACKVISDYLSVVKAYSRFFSFKDMDNMVHKLTFTYQKQPQVNEQFYTDAQYQINKPLTDEMDDLQKAHERLMNDRTKLTPQMKKYLGYCFESEEAQRVVREYFSAESQATREKDLKNAHDPKLSAAESKASAVSLSERMRNVFNTCIKVIRAFGDNKGVKPKKLCILFPRIMKDIREKPQPARLKPTPEIVTVNTRSKDKK